MATRCGSIDPGAVLHMCQTLGVSAGEVSALLNKESGLLGLSGWSGDMKSLLEFVHSGTASDESHHCPKLEASNLAIDCFVHRVAKEVASLLPALGSKAEAEAERTAAAAAKDAGPLDAIVFTGGMGENSAHIRQRICSSLQWLGVRLDHALNEGESGGASGRSDSNNSRRSSSVPRIISQRGSDIKLLVVPTDEELAIARATLKLVR